MSAPENAGSTLAQAWVSGKRLPHLSNSAPTDAHGAYQTQQVLVHELSNHYGKPVGYKIACTSKIAQEKLNIPEPFYGHLLSKLVYHTPAKISAIPFSVRIAEPEFAFRMSMDLPPQAEPYSETAIIESIAAIMPSIEVVDSRYEDWLTVGAPSLIADNACFGAWIVGPSFLNWRSFDLPNHAVDFRVNGESFSTGTGAAVLGSPIKVLSWLVNALHQNGQYIKKDDWITTGTCTPVYSAHAGDEIVADFGAMGKVELTFTA